MNGDVFLETVHLLWYIEGVEKKPCISYFHFFISELESMGSLTFLCLPHSVCGVDTRILKL